MFYRLNVKLHKKWFDFHARKIFHSPAVRAARGSNVLLLSQLHHPDLTMYMAAAKSFCRFLQPGQFVIVDDGLTDNDRNILSRHFEGMQFIRSIDVACQDTPRGSCWERLLSIADLNDNHYVIQLDADTLTMRRPDEVIECIQQGVSFTLGTRGWNEIISTDEASKVALGWEGDHVQVLAEQALSQLPSTFGRNYVHGCAGFAGFHQNCIDRQQIGAFSVAMTKLLGAAKWNEWGSEQVTSNFLVANSARAKILHSDSYPFWNSGLDVDQAKLIHFFGTHRFEGGQYRKLSSSLASEICKH